MSRFLLFPYLIDDMLHDPLGRIWLAITVIAALLPYFAIRFIWRKA